MAVWAKNAQIRNTVVVIDAVDVIQLQRKWLTIPFRTLTTFGANIGMAHRQVSFLNVDVIINVRRIFNEYNVVVPFPFAGIRSFKVQGNAKSCAVMLKPLIHGTIDAFSKTFNHFSFRTANCDGGFYGFRIVPDGSTISRHGAYSTLVKLSCELW